MGIDLYIDESSPNAAVVGSGHVSRIETCLFWRWARRVLNEGIPAPDNNVLVCVHGRDGERYPLLIMTLTRAGRLICWPVLPERICAPEDEEEFDLIDHVTLEITNRWSHSTTFDLTNERCHPHKWKARPYPENGISFWFGLAVRRSTVEDQVLKRHQWFRFPSRDRQRRKDEYCRLFNNLRYVDVGFPAEFDSTIDALGGLLFLVDGPDVKLSEELLQPFSEWPGEFWEAPAKQRTPNVISKGFSVGSIQLGLLLGVPPCSLREHGPVLVTPRKVRG